jgi:ADP-ribosylglycohydrolase
MFPRFATLAEDNAPGDALVAAAADACRAAVPDADEASLAWVRTASAAWGRLLNDPIGADDDQSNFLGKLVPVAARFAGSPDFARAVEESIRSTQDNDDAVAWGLPAARMVEAAVLGRARTGREAVEAALPHFSKEQLVPVKAALAAAESEPGEDPFDVVARLGASCNASMTVPVSVYFLARDKGDPGYAQALRANMLAGGESCARACLIGAVLGACKAGQEEAGGGVPESWVSEKLGARHRERALAAAGACEPSAA